MRGGTTMNDVRSKMELSEIKAKLIEGMFQHAKNEAINYSVKEGTLSFITYLYYFDGYTASVALCIGLEEEVKEIEERWGDFETGFYNSDFKYTKAFGNDETINLFNEYMNIVFEKSKDDEEYSTVEFDSILKGVASKLDEVEWDGLIKKSDNFKVTETYAFD